MTAPSVSLRAEALRRKLREAEHQGGYFSADDVAGMIADLKMIGEGARRLEQIERKDKAAEAVQRLPRSVPVGTFFFQPAH